MNSHNWSALCLIFLTWLVTIKGCNFSLTPTEQPPQLGPKVTAFIGIPVTSPALVQSENEGVEEFVARLAIIKIGYNTPVFITLTKIEDSEDL